MANFGYFRQFWPLWLILAILDNSGKYTLILRPVMSKLVNNGEAVNGAILAILTNYGEYLTGLANFGHFRIL